MADSPTPTQARASLAEPLITFFAATAIASALYWIGQSVALVRDNLHGAIALLFLTSPWIASRLSGRAFDYQEAGLHMQPLRRNLAVLGVAIAITWPLFFAAFYLFYDRGCAVPASSRWAYLLDWMTTFCGRWTGLRGASLRLPPDLLLSTLTQIIVIAVPEELFFRGYLLGRLQERWPPQARVLGAPVGWAVVGSSLLFGLGHVLVDFDPQRMAVMVPALIFGWMRVRAGSIAAGALFHALCNVYSEVLHASFFRS